MRLTLSEVKRVLGASGPDGDTVLTGAAVDSRKAGPGDLFVCLPGSRVDGHDFAQAAAKAGAAVVLAQRPVDCQAPVLLVEDTARALMTLGAYWRSRTGATVVAVTGSAGKTTVKELAAAILGRDAAVAKNWKNFNNQVGLPLSILAASGEEGAWVLEVGISRPGDMQELAPIVAPDVAVIHNIGPAHLEGLGNLAGVAAAKAALLTALAPGGKAFVSLDYPELWDEAQRIRPDAIGFSAQGREAAWSCRYLGANADGRGRFALDLSGDRLELELPYRGAHFAENIIAAAGAARLAGASLTAVREGLATAELPEQRFACRDAAGWLVIDDTYNANPLSMRRAIESACELAAGEGRGVVLVLGEMGELGTEAASAHRDLGRTVVESGCRTVFFSGNHFQDVLGGLGNGSWPGTALAVTSPGTFVEEFRKLGLPGGVVLFKGSRSRRMEEYLRAFLDGVCGVEVQG